MILKHFLSEAYPADSKVDSTELRIEMQPGLVSFGGHFKLDDGVEIPVDIRLIGKSKCGQFSNDIESLHRSTTNDGQNKWNKAIFKVDGEGRIDQELIWDEELESMNRESYQGHEAARQKWYWEEE